MKSGNLAWSADITEVLKKAQQTLHLLGVQRKKQNIFQKLLLMLQSEQHPNILQGPGSPAAEKGTPHSYGDFSRPLLLLPQLVD